MTKSIDVLTEAIRVADAGHRLDPGRYAGIAANALTDERIIANAVAAVRADQRENGYDSALGSFQCPDQYIEELAQLILGSVGDA